MLTHKLQRIGQKEKGIIFMRPQRKQVQGLMKSLKFSLMECIQDPSKLDLNFYTNSYLLFKYLNMEVKNTSDLSLDISINLVRHKIVFVGDVAVGKTSIINRFIENRFSESYDVIMYYT
jgi:hypothetical protein